MSHERHASSLSARLAHRHRPRHARGHQGTGLHRFPSLRHLPRRSRDGLPVQQMAAEWSRPRLQLFGPARVPRNHPAQRPARGTAPIAHVPWLPRYRRRFRDLGARPRLSSRGRSPMRGLPWTRERICSCAHHARPRTGEAAWVEDAHPGRLHALSPRQRFARWRFENEALPPRDGLASDRSPDAQARPGTRRPAGPRRTSPGQPASVHRSDGLRRMPHRTQVQLPVQPLAQVQTRRRLRHPRHPGSLSHRPRGRSRGQPATGRPMSPVPCHRPRLRRPNVPGGLRCA